MHLPLLMLSSGCELTEEKSHNCRTLKIIRKLDSPEAGLSCSIKLKSLDYGEGVWPNKPLSTVISKLKNKEAVQAVFRIAVLIALRHQRPVCSNYGNQVVLTTGSEWI